MDDNAQKKKNYSVVFSSVVLSMIMGNLYIDLGDNTK